MCGIASMFFSIAANEHRSSLDSLDRMITAWGDCQTLDVQ